MWLFKKETRVAVVEPEVQVKEVLSADNIGRYKLTLPQDDGLDAILEKAKGVLSYAPKALTDRKLIGILAELEIEVLNYKQVIEYQNSKTGKRGEIRTHFAWHNLQNYKEPVPVHVLNKAIQIKERLPEAEFSVVAYEEFVERQRSLPAGDPFLFVSYGGFGYFIEVWDEPTFEGRKEKSVA